MKALSNEQLVKLLNPRPHTLVDDQSIILVNPRYTTDNQAIKRAIKDATWNYMGQIMNTLILN